jgi:hypothetical protein
VYLVFLVADVRVHLFDGDWNENIGGAGISQLLQSLDGMHRTCCGLNVHIITTPRFLWLCDRLLGVF